MVMVERLCANKRCRNKFMARTADVKRGWGKFCSKSCKAQEQESRTGQHHNYLNSGVSRDKFIRYQNEYGGIPHFHSRTGDYEGFTGIDHEHDCNKGE